MTEDYIKDIRALLTEIKPLLESDYQLGSEADQAAASARLRLSAVRSELERVNRNLHEWQPSAVSQAEPGPRETK